MKYLLLFTLMSCGTARKFISEKPQPKLSCPKCESEYNQQVIDCMLKFANKGFDSEGVINICDSAFQKRK